MLVTVVVEVFDAWLWPASMVWCAHAPAATEFSSRVPWSIAVCFLCAEILYRASPERLRMAFSALSIPDVSKKLSCALSGVCMICLAACACMIRSLAELEGV